MTNQIKALVLFVIGLITGCGEQPKIPDWPEATYETRPWTRWWWHGSAVTMEGITSELESFKEVGLGGVEITPIYGVIGEEVEFIDYLSDKWVELLIHTLNEADRLGLGVDMATGTGWPFGGPWIEQKDAPKTYEYKLFRLTSGEQLSEPVTYIQPPLLRSVTNMVYQLYGLYKVDGEPITGSHANPEFRDKVETLKISDIRNPIASNENLQGMALDQVRFEQSLPLVTLMAFSENGDRQELIEFVSGGKLDWTAPAGDWTLIALFEGMHGKMVERAAPGGEGNTLDHFSAEAINTYLSKFDTVFRDKNINSLRAFFNDSYEVDDADGSADWTPELLNEFEKRRGYDLRDQLPALLIVDGEDHERVLSDYRETIGELLLEKFTLGWKSWATTNDAIIRNQAHGSPANILDLYAASDIPETEGNDMVSIKLASSAAHVSGKKLASSESATWLDEHFLSDLSDIRDNLDQYFLGGINHVFYHGTAYSPDDEWPGRLFCAAIHANDRNPLWNDFDAVNEYATRVQSFLQTGKPANDLLLYLPMYDLYADESETSLMHFHLGRGAFQASSAWKIGNWMDENGYSYDFISDNLLESVSEVGGNLTIGDLNYEAIVVPDSKYMPIRTLEKLVSLGRSGSSIFFLGDYPTEPPGFYDLENRRSAFRGAIGELQSFENVARIDTTELPKIEDLTRETMVDSGLRFVKRQIDIGTIYFIKNVKEKSFNDYINLSSKGKSVVYYDPMTGESGLARSRSGDLGTEVSLQLPARGSAVLLVGDSKFAGPQIQYLEESGRGQDILAQWKLNFVSGGPEFSRSYELESQTSWTEISKEMESFSGTISYSTTFELNENKSTEYYALDLGEVKESAEVILNGQILGTLIGPEFRLKVKSNLLGASNTLEVRVSNLMANRIAKLDKDGVLWKKFYNVNFPARLAENRKDGLFDASDWTPKPSGLIGPVRLIPMIEKE